MSTYSKPGQFDLHDDRDELSDDARQDDYSHRYTSTSASSAELASAAGRAVAHKDDLLEDVARSAALSVVGASLVFKGDLIADEDLLIQGSIHGTIEHNADNLTIGVHGKVRADVRARNILVQGEVHGNMYATGRVIVESSARVTGDIFAPTVGLKEGAKFKGSIDMDDLPDAKASPASKAADTARAAAADAAATGDAADAASGRKTRRRGSKAPASPADADEEVSDSAVDAALSQSDAPEKPD